MLKRLGTILWTILKKARRERKGQGLVEMALVLPLLLLLLFGILEFSRVLSAGIMVTHGARDAARCGVVGATDSEIICRVQTKTAAMLYDPAEPSKLAIEIERTGPDSGGDIAVIVSYPVNLYMPFIPGITGNPIVVAGKSVMRVE